MTRPNWQDFGTHDESAFPALWDGVIGAWAPCLGPTGSRLHDTSKRTNWGTLNSMDSATDWVVDGSQFSLDFDGIDDDVTASVPAGIAGATQATFSMWFRRKSTSTLSAFFGVGVASSDSNRFALQVWSDGQIYISTAPSTWGNFASNDTLWHHLVIAYDGGQATNATRMIAYFDGKPQTLSFTGTIGASIGTPTGLRIGRTHTVQNNYGSSIMDDMQIRLRTMSANEAALLYQLGRGGMYQRRRRRSIYLPQAGFQAAWARGSNVLLGFNQP